MSFMKAAMKLAAQGFYVFPLNPNGKTPAIIEFTECATTDPKQIERLWTDPVMKWEQPFNIGIATSKFKNGKALLVVDVDKKGGKDGFKTLTELELAGKALPPTKMQYTPTGGMHLIFWVLEPVKQGVDVLGVGLDIRSSGGYIVGAESQVEKGIYKIDGDPIRAAPQWLIAACQKISKKPAKVKTKDAKHIDQDRALKRAAQWLEESAVVAIEGQGGDYVTFCVACKVRDFGLTQDNALTVMMGYWNDRCEPPWNPDELQVKIENAYAYAVQGVIGANAPENDFKALSTVTKPLQNDEKSNDFVTVEEVKRSPIQELNQNHAFVTVGGGARILWETQDSKGKDFLDHLSIQTFHQIHASKSFMPDGAKKQVQLTEHWMKSGLRRSYDGLCFMPGKKAPERFYNLWKGFAVEPLSSNEIATPIMKESFAMFQDHTLQNVCNGQQWLYDWLMDYFAHLVQKPWEKPLVALVFKGHKGVGKNAMLERISFLLGRHGFIADSKRYLTSSFNGHLENLLLFGLDEVFWAGDKEAEGMLKSLITSYTQKIEHKGKEPFDVANCLRVAIIGNENWLVPASYDERRFAVFDVGEGYKQRGKFFHKMRIGLDEMGGSRLLLQHLMLRDISKFDISSAPKTKGLLDQKIESLPPVQQWWFSCLMEGEIVGYDFDSLNDWPSEVEKDRLRKAFQNYAKDRQIRSQWLPDERNFVKLITASTPGVEVIRRRENKVRMRFYKLPVLSVARQQWDEFIGHNVGWEKSSELEYLLS